MASCIAKEPIGKSWMKNISLKILVISRIIAMSRLMALRAARRPTMESSNGLAALGRAEQRVGHVCEDGVARCLGRLGQLVKCVGDGIVRVKPAGLDGEVDADGDAQYHVQHQHHVHQRGREQPEEDGPHECQDERRCQPGPQESVEARAGDDGLDGRHGQLDVGSVHLCEGLRLGRLLVGNERLGVGNVDLEQARVPLRVAQRRCGARRADPPDIVGIWLRVDDVAQDGAKQRGVEC
eukprot:scaffold5340_cov131-Isochrysis_galbana.AAC.13